MRACQYASIIQSADSRTQFEKSWLDDFNLRIGHVMTVFEESLQKEREIWARAAEASPIPTQHNLNHTRVLNFDESDRDQRPEPSASRPEIPPRSIERSHSPSNSETSHHIYDEIRSPKLKLNQLVVVPKKFQGIKKLARIWIEDYELPLQTHYEHTSQ